MVYLICFLAVLVMLLFLMGYGKSVNVYTVILTSVIAIGNGGYYALAMSTNLQEALLANKIAYVIGVFAPITIFFSICNLCRITISKRVSTVLFSIQVFFKRFMNFYGLSFTEVSPCLVSASVVRYLNHVESRISYEKNPTKAHQI